jgi:hypothetical protein
MIGWSKGLLGGWTKRYTTGVAYDEHRFTEVVGSEFSTAIIPDDRKLVYPFIGIEVLEDKYEKASNFDEIGRTEDRFLGRRLSARVGLSSSGLGADRNAWILDAAAQTGFGSSEGDTLLLAANFGGRVEEGVGRNVSLGFSAKYYRRQSDHRFFTSAAPCFLMLVERGAMAPTTRDAMSG